MILLYAFFFSVHSFKLLCSSFKLSFKTAIACTPVSLPQQHTLHLLLTALSMFHFLVLFFFLSLALIFHFPHWNMYQLTEINLGGRKITTYGFELLGKALSKNSHCRHLLLYDTEISVQGKLGCG